MYKISIYFFFQNFVTNHNRKDFHMSIGCCFTSTPVRPGFKNIQHIYNAFEAYEASGSGSSKDAALHFLKQTLDTTLPSKPETTGAAEIQYRMDALTGFKKAGFFRSADMESAYETYGRILSAVGLKAGLLESTP